VAGKEEIEQGGAGAADMQITGRRRGEANDRGDSFFPIGHFAYFAPIRQSCQSSGKPGRPGLGTEASGAFVDFSY
jgi:hypothetical protein